MSRLLSHDSTIFFRSDFLLPRSKTQQVQFSGSHDPFSLFLVLFLIASRRYLVVTVLDDVEGENCVHVAGRKGGTLDSHHKKGSSYSRVSIVMPTSRVTLTALSHCFWHSCIFLNDDNFELRGTHGKCDAWVCIPASHVCPHFFKLASFWIDLAKAFSRQWSASMLK